MKTLLVLCLLVACAAYGCQRAIDKGVITEVDKPGVHIIPPQTPKANRNPRNHTPFREPDKKPDWWIHPQDDAKVLNISHSKSK